MASVNSPLHDAPAAPRSRWRLLLFGASLAARSTTFLCLLGLIALLAALFFWLAIAPIVDHFSGTYRAPSILKIQGVQDDRVKAAFAETRDSLALPATISRLDDRSGYARYIIYMEGRDRMQSEADVDLLARKMKESLRGHNTISGPISGIPYWARPAWASSIVVITRLIAALSLTAGINLFLLATVRRWKTTPPPLPAKVVPRTAKKEFDY